MMVEVGEGHVCAVVEAMKVKIRTPLLRLSL
jgi:hypothetical protein